MARETGVLMAPVFLFGLVAIGGWFIITIQPIHDEHIGDMMSRKTIALCQFPGQHHTHPDPAKYMTHIALSLKPQKFVGFGDRWEEWQVDHPVFDRMILWTMSDTPITMSRNRCIVDCEKLGVDYCFMIDWDMAPDEPNLGCKPFFPTAVDFLQKIGVPACVAAPYVGPGRNQNIYVFRWRNFNNRDGLLGTKLDQFTREEAAERSGIEHVAALATGLILYDMRLFSRIPHPRFYYEFDETYTKKHSTEDVTNTRDISLIWHDVPHAGCYINWDAWAEHIKLTHFGKPRIPTNDAVGESLRKAWGVGGGRSVDDRLVMVGDGGRHMFGPAVPASENFRTDAVKISADPDFLIEESPENDSGRLHTVNVEKYTKAMAAAYPEITPDRSDV